MKLPRVTTILKACGMTPDFGFMPPERQQYYLDRGSAVHKACELYDSGQLDMDSIDERIKGYVEGWVKFRNATGGKVSRMEWLVESPEWGYLGHVDRIMTGLALGSGGDVLLDIKTSRSYPYSHLQTAAYALAGNLRGIMRGVVSLTKRGTWAWEAHKDDSDYDDWLACLRVYKWQVRNLPQPPEEEADDNREPIA